MRMLNISRIDDLVANSMDILEPAPVDADGKAREDGTCLSLSFTAKLSYLTHYLNIQARGKPFLFVFPKICISLTC